MPRHIYLEYETDINRLPNNFLIVGGTIDPTNNKDNFYLITLYHIKKWTLSLISILQN